MSFAWLSSRFFAATKTRLLPPLAWCVSTQGQKCRLADRLTRNAPCSRMWADPPHHPTRPEPSPPATSLKGHQRPKSPDSTSGGLGSNFPVRKQGRGGPLMCRFLDAGNNEGLGTLS